MTNKRTRVSSGTEWEARVGYCRAIAVGSLAYVSGTVAVDDEGRIFAPGDAYAQTRRCLVIIERALQALGADMQSVVRTRMYVTDFTDWEAIARAHREVFAEHPPASTMVAVAALIDPATVVEIEAEAILPADLET
ncbi:MAG: RidA family protein [Cyanobacteria bacterium J06639_1]